MRRYRTVIVLALLGAIPMVAAIFVARLFLTGGEPQPAPAPAPAPVVEKEEAPSEPPPTHKVLAAARMLPVGTLLGDEDLAAMELEQAAIRPGYYLADATAAAGLHGHAVRKAIAAGAPLTRAAVVGPGERGFLAAVLRSGTRAVTVQLEASARHAGLIDPGDRVDVIFTAALQSGETENVLTRTILEDVRVVAVDHVIGEGGQVERDEIRTATLEVRPAQADQLALAQHQGRLSLAVRSLVAGAGAPRPGAAAVDLRELLTPPTAVAETRKVFAAARPLAVGTLLADEDVVELELEWKAVGRQHIVAEDGVATLRGHAVRTAVAAGAPLTRAAVVAPGQPGFLAAALRPGTRAVTVRLEEAAREAGLIDPGARVDVILTAPLSTADGSDSVLTRTILEDARVVAIDRWVGRGSEARGDGDATAARAGIVTATLEVRPEQADRLTLGMHEGRLSLAVRSLAAAGRGGGATVGLRELLAPARGAAAPDATAAAPGVPARKTVRVIRGGELTEEVFSGLQPIDAGPNAHRRSLPASDPATRSRQ